MNLRPLIAVSLLVNLVLAGAGWKLAARPSRPVREMTDRVVVFNGRPLRGASNGLRIDITVTNLSAAFRWSSLPHDNYTNYIAGLRAIGCPEQTIGDLVLAELTDECIRRRRALLGPLQNSFWTLAKKGLDHAVDDYKSRLEEIDRETVDRIEELLPGGKPGQEPVPHQAALYAYLPLEKQTQIARLEEAMDQAIKAAGEDKTLTKAEREKRTSQARELFEAGLTETLTPEELAEAKLRRSSHTQALGTLAGIDLSPTEARALVPVLDGYDEAVRGLTGATDRAAGKAEAAAAKEEGLRAILGDRYDTYMRAQDPGYAPITVVARRFDLGGESIQRVDDLRKTVAQAEAALQSNRALTDAQRRVALVDIRREAQSAVQQALGEKITTVYRAHGGEWFNPANVEVKGR